MTVSRETAAFGERLPLAERYAEILATTGVERGLIGPREVDRLWDRHLLNCAAPVVRVPENATVADVGAGAGLPGLVWAIARPDLHVTLIEPLLRRATFLEEASAELGLDNVTVLRARAEEVSEKYDVVTARAVAALDKLGRWCMPLVKPGGFLLALKGRSAAEEVESARATLKRLKAGDIVVATYGQDWGLEVPTTVVEVQRR
ncbi:16S rRNA (guanine(527)-N(7))-methyltransferase RsmG [Aeromicrobium senzhongii]|uniref:Ribosomal RNA small subunit methyltransferase G n=1 Tax=Aeromicrobium senzhongii TaxID=2663859 RepID=A0ABX6SSN4_9ACTN|nr:16S rRNA (guanine(527)-N(7))-methyltransferase RsmG [Aeromicrobium senzhongii]MTB89446.1 16S rRNA (guanine(527)-N(7))-methyltransferase RsmG [Aeromicrobium senzhongii]QNL94414.1 16S rRNA (guanine(527)-N(7))-methyltransferase RsmG [Aeromicrobium senzhongii]